MTDAEDTELRLEVVEAACGHLVPRPAGWRDGNVVGELVARSPGLFGLQAKLDDYGRELGASYVTSLDLTVRDQQTGFTQTAHLLSPVVVCPECDAKLREQFGVPEGQTNVRLTLNA